MLDRVDWQIVSDSSKILGAFIFRVR